MEVENGVLEDVFSLVSKWAIFHHDYGRKGFISWLYPLGIRGVIVNEIGMRPMITQFQQEFIWPIASRCHVVHMAFLLIHPQKLTWNLEMMVSNRNLLFQGSIFRFHVCFGGCICCFLFISVIKKVHLVTLFRRD